MSLKPVWERSTPVDLAHELNGPFDPQGPSTDILNNLFGDNFWMQTDDLSGDDMQGFNQTRFNTIDYIIVDFDAFMTGQTSLESLSSGEFNTSTQMSGNTDLVASFIRELGQQLILQASSNINSTMTRERTHQTKLSGVTNLKSDSGRFHIDVIEFEGEFKPGDKIIIDTDKLKLTQNGQNALHAMLGDFFDLNAGSNLITYTDDEAGRSVRIRLTHRDRFV